MLHVRHDGVLVGVGHEVTHVGAFEVGIAVEDLFYHHYYFKIIIIETRKCQNNVSSLSSFHFVYVVVSPQVVPDLVGLDEGHPGAPMGQAESVL